MNAANHWKYENVLRRPMTIEGRSKRNTGHSETHSASTAETPKGGWPCQRPLKQKEKAPIGAFGRIQYQNVAEGMGLTSNLLWPIRDGLLPHHRLGKAILWLAPEPKGGG